MPVVRFWYDGIFFSILSAQNHLFWVKGGVFVRMEKLCFLISILPNEHPCMLLFFFPPCPSFTITHVMIRLFRNQTSKFSKHAHRESTLCTMHWHKRASERICESFFFSYRNFKRCMPGVCVKRKKMCEYELVSSEKWSHLAFKGK